MTNTYNIFFPICSEWEYDFFKKDLFPQHNFFEYDYDFDFSSFENQLNILIISFTQSWATKVPGLILQNTKDNDIPDFLKKTIEFLKPFCIFHLSDEDAKTQKYHTYYNNSNCKIVFHQYNSNNLIYHNNHYQIPLAYIKGFPQELKLNKNKKYDFSFVGQLKSDRMVMLHLFQNNFPRSVINVGNTNWSSTNNQTINPQLLYQIYNESIFVPIGRGNVSLDCFRLYECIIAGAIPVIVGTEKEIKEGFNYDMPTIIYSDNWESVITKCKEIYNNKEEIEKIILSNFNWWNNQISFIKNKIDNLE